MPRNSVKVSVEAHAIRSRAYAPALQRGSTSAAEIVMAALSAK
jgi:hypothetical protein